MLFPLLFALPLLLSLWHKRRIGRGKDVEIVFELVLPSKWAAQLTQQALSAGGTSSRIHRDRQHWLCSVSRVMEYHAEAVTRAARGLDQIASARGGSCKRYVVKRGKQQEVHSCEVENQRLEL